jgi:hypothetical protein
MTKEGIFLRFTTPDGWTESTEGSRLVLQGPNREELIISGMLITGNGQAEESTHLKRVLFERTVEVVKKTAAHPDLRIIQDLKSDPRVSEFDCWTGCAEIIGFRCSLQALPAEHSAQVNERI